MKEDLLMLGKEGDSNNRENKELNMLNNSKMLIGKDMMILEK
jgi:hypothetical protein